MVLSAVVTLLAFTLSKPVKPVVIVAGIGSRSLATLTNQPAFAFYSLSCLGMIC